MKTGSGNTFLSEEDEFRLWGFIDGTLNDRERTAVENLIAENALWKSRYQELLSLHQSLNLVELEQPSMRFTRNVMDEIARLQISPATKKYINNRVVWGIGVFFIAMLIGILGFGIAQIDWSVANDSSSTLGIDFNKVDFSRIFNNTIMNVFMMLNVVLGLFLFDRYLSNKRRKLLEEQ